MMQAVMMKAEEAQNILHKTVTKCKTSVQNSPTPGSRPIRIVDVTYMGGDIRQLVQKSTGGVCPEHWPVIGGGTALLFRSCRTMS